ncbi:hypothetical protein CYLTODRAFT_486592 [Cylindrobasidium torrendii FP15055 ss-10]|uniref:Uncharacterized protein n=1 Tax=Cylindrobasidium torrendii FP15055 ss-10 TaxID=1314674 RepID=A0A0D7BP54_9AGAR|nr:hypothetical protein CYLTODRAFT_486592 [Cylindrobasidium torrendii FP15055 ss-10]
MDNIELPTELKELVIDELYASRRPALSNDSLSAIALVSSWKDVLPRIRWHRFTNISIDGPLSIDALTCIFDGAPEVARTVRSLQILQGLRSSVHYPIITRESHLVYNHCRLHELVGQLKWLVHIDLCWYFNTCLSFPSMLSANNLASVCIDNFRPSGNDGLERLLCLFPSRVSVNVGRITRTVPNSLGRHISQDSDTIVYPSSRFKATTLGLLPTFPMHEVVLLSTLSQYFPDMKTLTVACRFNQASHIVSINDLIERHRLSLVRLSLVPATWNLSPADVPPLWMIPTTTLDELEMGIDLSTRDHPSSSLRQCAESLRQCSVALQESGMTRRRLKKFTLHIQLQEVGNANHAPPAHEGTYLLDQELSNLASEVEEMIWMIRRPPPSWDETFGREAVNSKYRDTVEKWVLEVCFPTSKNMFFEGFAAVGCMKWVS